MEKEEDDVPLIDEQVIDKPKGFPQCRHMLSLLAFLGFVNVYCLRVNLSVALVAMVNRTESKNTSHINECPGQNDNDTNSGNDDKGEFDWDSNTQGLILGSFFYGYILTQIPGGWLAERIGGKRLFGFGVLCTSILTILTPFAARLSVYALIALRILEGIGEGVTFPAMHAMLSKWAPPLERSKLGTFIYAGAQFGTVISLPVSGLLCGSKLGWPSVFYLFGALGCVWFGFWMLFTFDSPAQHPRISEAEKCYIETSIGHNEKKRLPTPWGAIFTSIPFWSLINAHFCNNWGFYTLLTTLPTYMKEVLHFDISQNGLLSALPYLVMWIVINIGGQVADFLRFNNYMSTTKVRKLFNMLGGILPAVFLVATSYLGCDTTLAITMVCLTIGSGGFVQAGTAINHLDLASPFAGFCLPATFLVITGYVGCDTIIAVAMVTLAVGTGGLALSGYQVNHLDLASPFSGTLLGITNCAATIPGFVGPQVVGVLTNNDPSRGQWRKVFFISAAVYVWGALVYLIFGSGVEQPWARQEYFDAKNAKKQQRKQEEDDREVLTFNGGHSEDSIQHVS